MGVVATEQPEPIQAILAGYWTICLKNASSATVLLHYTLDGVCIQEKSDPTMKFPIVLHQVWGQHDPPGIERQLLNIQYNETCTYLKFTC